MANYSILLFPINAPIIPKQIQWTLAYPNLVYPNSRIIRTSNFEEVVTKENSIKEGRQHRKLNTVQLIYFFSLCIFVHAAIAAAKMASSRTVKRKRVVLSIETKLAILDKVAKGATQSDLAREYNIGRSTVTDLKRNEAKLREFATGLDDQGISSSRKIMRLAKEQQVEEAVYLWFVQKRSQDTPVSGPLLKEKAKEFHEKLHIEEDDPPSFTASSGWLWRFCNRHGIRELSLQGEQLSSDPTATEPFKKKLQKISL